jgi:hypothetical protein
MPTRPLPSLPSPGAIATRAVAQAGGNAVGAYVQAIASAPRPLASEPATPAEARVSLSPQALAWPAAAPNQPTAEIAHQFVAQQVAALFGDTSPSPSVDFATLSVSANARLATGAAPSRGAVGVAPVARLDQSTQFIGSGQINTADGQAFAFKLEVTYQALGQAASGNAAPGTSIEAPDALALIGKALPTIAFPGSLADLFTLLGRQLTVSANDGHDDGASGDLSLRLVHLVNSAALLAPRPQPDDPQATPAERNKALASYAAPAPNGTALGSA